MLWKRMRARQKNLTPEAFRQRIYRLGKQGVVETDGETIHICREDLAKLAVKNNSVMKNIYPGKTERVLLSFDIPETKKKTRDWLRNQIKYWDFEMIHKSLWLGHGPLPKEFGERLRVLGIYENIRVFRVRKAT